MVLFGHSPAERTAATGTSERTVYRQVARFAQLGMASCVPLPKVEKYRALPPALAAIAAQYHSGAAAPAATAGAA